ncbi:MAG: hypothetical protein PVG75_08505 [Thioalkalispiraceae bacterium]|jgi:hypothetical protein
MNMTKHKLYNTMMLLICVTALTGCAPSPTSAPVQQLAAPPGITAAETVPQITLEPTGPEARKLLLIKGTIDGNQLTVSETQIIKGYPPNRFAGTEDLTIELMDTQNNVMQTVGMMDPRITHILDDNGGMYLREQADFVLVVPYIRGSTAFRIKANKPRLLPSKQARQKGITIEKLTLPPVPIRSIKLKPAFEQFCDDKQNDTDCDFIIRSKALPKTVQPLLPETDADAPETEGK